MKGVIKYKGKFYHKSSKPPKEGDLVKLVCAKSHEYFKYNGIYTLGKYNEILVPLKEEDGKKYFQVIKLGYNVCLYNRNWKRQYYKLIEIEKFTKKNLPNLVKEEEIW